MITVSVPAEQRLRLSAVPWEAYVQFSDSLGERPIRVTYDRGEMEVMPLSDKHERKKKLLGRLIEALTEEMEIDIASSGMMTRRCKHLQRAIEPDESYWIANEWKVRGRYVDIDEDLPPDLAVEMEISRSTLHEHLRRHAGAGSLVLGRRNVARLPAHIQGDLSPERPQ